MLQCILMHLSWVLLILQSTYSCTRNNHIYFGLSSYMNVTLPQYSPEEFPKEYAHHWLALCNIFGIGCDRSALRFRGRVTGTGQSYAQAPVALSWRIMMTSSNGNIFRVTGLLCGEFTGPRWIPAQRPVTRSFEVSFDLHPNKQLSKQSWGWWSETPSSSLWRHRNV